MRARDAAARIVAWAAFAGAAASGCGSFQDVTTVVDLRVLAINTEPSEIILYEDDPSTNVPITVTPLLPDPLAGQMGRGPVTWTLVACPNNPYGASPPSGGAPGMLGGGARTTVGSSTCDPNSDTTWPLDPTQPIQFTADQIMQAVSKDVYVDQYGTVHGGVDLGLLINLQITATDGVQTVVAIKRLLYWLIGPDLYWKTLLDPMQTPNVTPTIPELRTYPDRDPVTGDLVGDGPAWEAGTPLPVALGQTVWVAPTLDEATREPYWTAVIDRDAHVAVPLHVDRERIRYAFYATAGHFEPPRSVSELLPGAVGTIHLESKYIPPATIEGDGLVTVWIVVRDERGGESWVERQIQLVQAM